MKVYWNPMENLEIPWKFQRKFNRISMKSIDNSRTFHRISMRSMANSRNFHRVSIEHRKGATFKDTEFQATAKGCQDWPWGHTWSSVWWGTANVRICGLIWVHPSCVHRWEHQRKLSSTHVPHPRAGLPAQSQRMCKPPILTGQALSWCATYTGNWTE